MGICGSKNGSLEETKQNQKTKVDTLMKSSMEQKSKKQEPTLDKKEQNKNSQKWKRIPIPDTVKVNCHEHEIKKFTDTTQDDWMCNGIQIYPKGCYSGITDFHQT